MNDCCLFELLIMMNAQIDEEYSLIIIGYVEREKLGKLMQFSRLIRITTVHFKICQIFRAASNAAFYINIIHIQLIHETHS